MDRGADLPLPEIDQFADAVAEALSPYRSVLSAYDWQTGDDVLEEARKRWGLQLNSDADVFEKTVRLRRFISEEARGAWQRREDLIELATFVIRRWGNLKANSDKTIEDFVDRFGRISVTPEAITGHDVLLNKVVDRRGLWRFEGIASWSKWVNFLWPEWALIYDARIAFGLNAIHFLSRLDTPVFPQPVGRNALLSNFDAGALSVMRRCASSNSTLPNTPEAIMKWFHGQQFNKSRAYPIYLEVMRRAHGRLWSDIGEPVPLVHTEMLLFRVSANQLATDFAGGVIKALASAADE